MTFCSLEVLSRITIVNDVKHDGHGTTFGVVVFSRIVPPHLRVMMKVMVVVMMMVAMMVVVMMAAMMVVILTWHSMWCLWCFLGLTHHKSDNDTLLEPSHI